MKTTIPLELADIFYGADDAEPVMEAPDVFAKLLQDAEFAGAIDGRPGVGFGHVEAFHEEAAQRNAPLVAHYKKIAATAQAATKKNAPAGGTDPRTLEKRFSSPDPRSVYREFFKTAIADGKTAVAALDGWLAEFPHRNPDVEKLMRESCAEFA